MMSQTVPAWFQKQYDTGVHVALQRQGGILRPTVRSKNLSNADTNVFRKVGTGVAAPKARHGDVPIMNLDHATVEVPVADYFAADWIEKKDLEKTDADEMAVITQSAAWACGRKEDDLIIAAMTGKASSFGDATTTLVDANLSRVTQLMNAALMPDDGNRHVIVSSVEWEFLMAIDSFVNSEYIGEHILKGTTAGHATRKYWRGAWWHSHEALPIASGYRTCVAYHKSCIGHVMGGDIMSDITWHGEKQAWLAVVTHSVGAGRIDDNGIITFRTNATAVIS